MRILTVPFLAFAVLLCSSCTSKKTERKDIIVAPPVKKEMPTGPKQMTQTRQHPNAEWLGSTYNMTITRQVEKSLPIVTDESGIKYYDNTIQLLIQREDGTGFLNRTFNKEDFVRYAGDNKLVKNSALLGIVYDKDRTKQDPSRLYFAASIGSPDVRSDEFIPFVLSIGKDGQVSIRLDDQIDSGSNSDDEEGV